MGTATVVFKSPAVLAKTLFRSAIKNEWNFAAFCYRKASSYDSVGQNVSTERKLTKSYACGPSAGPKLGLTLGSLLQRSADLWGDDTAVVFSHQNIRKTFQQLVTEVDLFPIHIID